MKAFALFAIVVIGFAAAKTVADDDIFDELQSTGAACTNSSGCDGGFICGSSNTCVNKTGGCSTTGCSTGNTCAKTACVPSGSNGGSQTDCIPSTLTSLTTGNSQFSTQSCPNGAGGRKAAALQGTFFGLLGICPLAQSCGDCILDFMCRRGVFSNIAPSTPLDVFVLAGFGCVQPFVPLATPQDYYNLCNPKGSPKGLLGLLGLLGLIPLLLCLLCLCLLLLRRKKREQDVHFATFDAAPASAALVPPTMPPPMMGAPTFAAPMAPSCAGAMPVGTCTAGAGYPMM